MLIIKYSTITTTARLRWQGILCGTRSGNQFLEEDFYVSPAIQARGIEVYVVAFAYRYPFEPHFAQGMTAPSFMTVGCVWTVLRGRAEMLSGMEGFPFLQARQVDISIAAIIMWRSFISIKIAKDF